MNRISSKIIMLVVMLGIFLLPISPIFEIKNDGQIAVGIKTNKVKAETINVASGAGVKDTYADYNIVLLNTGETSYIAPTSDQNGKFFLIVNLLKGSKATDPNNMVNVGRQTLEFKGGTAQQTIPLKFEGLTPDTDYFFSIIIHRSDAAGGMLISETIFRTAVDPTHTGTTNTTNTDIGSKAAANVEELDLRCNLLNPMEGWYGCIAGIFWLVFKLAAMVGHFAGSFLDFFIYYSTSSTSYGGDSANTFITKGWGAVRDVANIFFIIALLYIAIKMILSLGDSHGKKLISTIIIVALLINFSLFVTQVVIDGSNILAKVFYNNIDQKYANGSAATGATGEKSISTGLMDKFNPEKILTQDVYDAEGGTITFILLTLILIAIILYTSYVFFSVALLFVSRVVMLWFSMIFAPIAFASYTLPFDIPGLGHKEWWKNLFENAFMAPIFVFLLYLIVMFAGFLKEIVKYPENADIMQKVMGVVIPFILLMVLLMKAKEMAVKYSGEMGAAMVKGAAVLGGLALGGAALGTAALARGTIGAFIKASSTGDSAAQRYKDGESINKWDKFKGKLGQGVGKALTFGKGDMTSIQGWVGKKINKGQDHLEEAKHARHELDTAADAVAKGKTWNELTGDQRYMARRKMARDRAVRANSGSNPAFISGGLGTRKWDALSPKEQEEIDALDEVGNNFATGKPLAGKALDEHRTEEDKTWIREARHKQGLGVSFKQSLVTGTYDVRNLSKVVAEQQDTMMNKFASGLTSAMGHAMRGSIKTAFGSEYGTSQKKFFADLGHTVSEAMKGAKINIDLSHVGAEVKEGHKEKGGGGHH